MMVRVCVLQGVGVLFIPKIGLTLFIVLYTFGNICALCRSAPTATGSSCTFYKIFFPIGIALDTMNNLYTFMLSTCCVVKTIPT